MDHAVEKRDYFRFGPFEFDSRTLELFRGGRLVRLAPKPASVLGLLLQRAGELILREDFREAFWPDADVDFDHSLNTCILQIRRALRDDAGAPAYIETVPKRGYRFRAVVDILPPEVSATGRGRRSTTPPPVPSRTGEGRGARARVPVGRRFRHGLILTTLGAAALLTWSMIGGAHRRSAPTLLVLPFTDLTHAAESSYFIEGLTDDVIAALSAASVSELRVIGLASSESLSAELVDTGRMPGGLSVDYLVRGSVRQVDSTVRVVASIVDVRDSTTLWARSFERPHADRMTLQSDIAIEVAASLSIRLELGDIGQRAEIRSTEAFDAYEAGRYLIRRSEWESGVQSIEQFTRATLLDPAFPPAFARLAEAHLWFGSRQAARRAVDRALTLNPSDPHAHYVASQLGIVAGDDWTVAEAHARRAVLLRPGSSDYRVGLAYLLSIQGRGGDAVREMRRATEINPVSPFVSGDAGMIHYWAGDYAAASTACRRTLELKPRIEIALRAYDCLVNAETLRGDTASAVEAAFAWIASAGATPEVAGVETAGPAARQLRSFREWRLARHLDARRQGRPVSYELARLYADVGQEDDAIAALAAAAQERTILFPTAVVEPRFRGLRDDPRFRSIVAGDGEEA